MVKFVPVMLMLLAALFLARGPAIYGAQPARDHIHASHAELTLHRGLTPVDGHQIEIQCSKAGCALASCQVQSVTAAILPDCPSAIQPSRSLAYALPRDVTLSSLHNEPASPPPKSPIDHPQAA
ncbi:hypothetical protein GCM10010924_01440 [Rhizobium wenxiniae]|uniref:DUF2946 domain-containing protein n=1 Tax=Rhizobium wenxiniae TaxID=1737357 RepID=A0A7W9Y4V5_9HYPH|nr:hypothetical protein [Rhizobium wenxiniae]MBB6162021.1 hypothetical protein [Rhizobium wenxiniae]GGF78154.1 hypothetical protein GCM10010924_01440 [Rhizobium wenxiniae]